MLCELISIYQKKKKNTPEKHKKVHFTPRYNFNNILFSVQSNITEKKNRCSSRQHITDIESGKTHHEIKQSGLMHRKR